MFELDTILEAVIEGDLNFERAYIRRRRGEKFRIRSHSQVSPRPACTIDTDRVRGWKMALKWLMKRHNITAVNIQSNQSPPLPKSLKILQDIDSASPDEILLIIADSMHVTAPPANVTCIGLLKEAKSHKVKAPFYAIYTMLELEGLSTPLFKRLGQDHILLPPWVQSKSVDNLLNLWDLANPIDQINVELLSRGESPWPTFIRLTETASETFPAPHKIEGLLFDELYSTTAHNHDHDHDHDHGCDHETNHTAPHRITNIQRILNGLCHISPDRYLKGLHPHSANCALNAVFQSISDAEFEKIEEDEMVGHAIIIPPKAPFTEVLCLTAGLLAKGWRVGLHPQPEQAGLCAILAQLGQDYGLDIDLNSQFAHCDRILVAEQLPPSLEWLRSDPRLRWCGPRLSVCIVSAATTSLAYDTLLHDGMGPYAPATIFALNPSESWLGDLQSALDDAQESFPASPVIDQYHRRLRKHRMAIAKRDGAFIEGKGWDIALLKPKDWSPTPTPRLLNIVQIESVDQMVDLLKPHIGRLHTLGTDMASPALKPVGEMFLRRCHIGFMQMPSVKARLHGFD